MFGVFKSKGTVVINGKSFSGNNISIVNGVVKIDGKIVEDSDAIMKEHVLNISVQGDLEELSTTSGDVEVSGSVGNIKTTSGDVFSKGDVQTVTTVSGDVRAKSIGSAKSVNGDISID